MTPEVSLIISTYNWPDALNLVLKSVANQSTYPAEVIIADDGSRQDTTDLVQQQMKNFPCPLIHVWQEDDGFQLARIRNKAAIKASGNYLIYLDGDCILKPDFIKNHIKLAKIGHFVAGNRILMSEPYSRQVLADQTDISRTPPASFSKDQVNRPWALNTLALGPLRDLRSTNWKLLKGCNFALWKDDFLAINGVDEAFVGWGYEDSEMTIRLLRRGIKLRSGRLATTVLHIWHREQDRSAETENWQRLQDVLNGNKSIAEKGVNQYQRDNS